MKLAKQWKHLNSAKEKGWYAQPVKNHVFYKALKYKLFPTDVIFNI